MTDQQQETRQMTTRTQIIEREQQRHVTYLASIGIESTPGQIAPEDLPGGRRHFFETADEVAAWNAANGTDDLIASTWEGYRPVARPKVGEKVSSAFNGDYYPQGEIVKVSPTSKKVTTSTGAIFYRVKDTGCWKEAGTWSMVRGHVSRLNPHF